MRLSIIVQHSEHMMKDCAEFIGLVVRLRTTRGSKANHESHLDVDSSLAVVTHAINRKHDDHPAHATNERNNMQDERVQSVCRRLGQDAQILHA